MSWSDFICRFELSMLPFSSFGSSVIMSCVVFPSSVMMTRLYISCQSMSFCFIAAMSSALPA